MLGPYLSFLAIQNLLLPRLINLRASKAAPIYTKLRAPEVRNAPASRLLTRPHVNRLSATNSFLRSVPTFNCYMVGWFGSQHLFVLPWKSANPQGEMATNMLLSRGSNAKSRHINGVNAKSPLRITAPPSQIREQDKIVYTRFFALSSFRHDNSPNGQCLDISSSRKQAHRSYSNAANLLLYSIGSFRSAYIN